MTKRNLAILLAWNNFSEYYSQQLASAISEYYETTVAYGQLDWDSFDVLLSFFPQRSTGCDPGKVIKCLWEPHEFGWARDAGTVLAASSFVYNRIVGIYGEKAHLVPWGVNPDHFSYRQYPTEGEFIVGWAGNYGNPRKQFDQLESMLQEIEGIVFRPSKCHMVNGEQVGPYESVAVMADYYEGINLYVCASAGEGFGFPLLESAAVGRPVATFDVGVARDLKATGAHVMIANDWESLKLTVMQCRDNVPQLELWSKASAYAVETSWTWDRLRDRWLEILNKAG